MNHPQTNQEGSTCGSRTTISVCSCYTRMSRRLSCPYNSEKAYLISCGIGNVLSSPRATNPRMVTYMSEVPKIRNNMARHILSVTSCERSRYNRVDNTHINPAKNSMYCVYIRHCQNEKGRVEVPRLSGLTVGRYFKQMKSNASYQVGHFLCIMHDISTRTCATIMKSD